MRCEDVLGTLASGSPLSAEIAAHLAGCPRCTDAVQLASFAGGLQPLETRAPLVRLADLRRRERAAQVRTGMLAAAALVLAISGGWWLGQADEAPAVVAEATPIDPFGDAFNLDPLGDGLAVAEPSLDSPFTGGLAPDLHLTSPTDVLEAALLGEGSL